MIVNTRPMFHRFDPAENALDIIKQWFPTSHEYLMLAAYSGSHMLNPYHNIEHELHHVYWAHACALNSHELIICEDDQKMRSLIFSSLFHDHNHSGGLDGDDHNVSRSLRFALTLAPRVAVDINEVGWNIRTTQFKHGDFPVEPHTEGQKCMRDADLMMIYTSQGRNVLLHLLEEVLGKKWTDLDQEETECWLTRNEAFLNSAEMFTSFGQHMKRTQLPKAHKDFRERVTRFRSYSKYVSSDQ
jgi:hypothetical protein